jgi:HAD superfamily hydrolase (TIGR01549 family)
VSLLLCDLDDTLVDRAGAFASWAGRFCLGLGLDAGGLAWLVAEDRDGFRPRPELFALVRDRFGLAASVDDLTADFYREFPALFHCDEAVRDALTRARSAGWRIGIVTNGSPTQELKIRAAGLDALVDTWCISAVEGVRKPDSRLLELAAERCGAPLTGGWLVGDAPEADIGAARRAGISSIWLRRGREWPRDDYAPTMEADSFPQAMARLLGER